MSEAAGTPDPLEERAAPVDTLLTDAALGGVRRWLPVEALARGASALARHPDALAAQGRELAEELRRITAGVSEVEPDPKDKRFADPAWRENPLLHRVLQGWLAGGRAARGVVQEVRQDPEVGWRDAERLELFAENVVEALAPSNSPLLNPVALRTAVETGGRSFAQGAANFVRDMRSSPRVPSMVDADAFEVGGNLAVTPGAVVLRTEVFELLQYAPSTPRVREVPLVLVPPTINKFYVVDLAPGRSMVEHFVAAGQQVFLVSWRNPDQRHADWGFDTYAGAVLEALDAAERITGADRSVLLGLCSGGVLASLAASSLAARGQPDRLAGLTLGVTVLDQAGAGTAAALLDPEVAEQAAAASARQGYLDGRTLAELFAWLRPNDLIWSYWVNNYLLGKSPPAFDVLYWNADTTRMAAALHRDFLRLGVENSLATPGATTVLGAPVDLSKVTVDSYVVAGIADHLCPWQSCYRSGRLLGGRSRFVLSTSGHVVALVNPPGNPKASYRVADVDPAAAPGPAQWLQEAQLHPGSWWPDFVEWLAARSGAEQDAPERLGGPGLEPLESAPGRYVRDR